MKSKLIITYSPPVKFEKKVSVVIAEQDENLLNLAQRLFNRFGIVNPDSYKFVRQVPQNVCRATTVVLNNTLSWARFLRAVRPKSGTFQNW
jgi:hypothetical protein